jgi:ZIP family zinc transporter
MGHYPRTLLAFARLRSAGRALQGFLNALATGILVYLLWDVISKAGVPVNTALEGARHGSAGPFAGLLALFVLGFGTGLLGLIYLERMLIRPSAQGVREGTVRPHDLALMIAVGIRAPRAAPALGPTAFPSPHHHILLAGSGR